MSCQRLNLYR